MKASRWIVLSWWAVAGGVAATDSDRIRPLADMPSARAAHSATRLPDGRVLLAGGCRADGCEEGMAGDAVLFDPARDAFEPAGSLQQARVGHRAVALADGSVLLMGGWSGTGATASVERFDPVAGAFQAHGQLLQARDAFTATLLRDGRVLVVGGYADGEMRPLAQAEIYDPATGSSSATGDLATARRSHTATLLGDGSVLIAGGSDTRRSVTATLERFDPATDGFLPAGSLAKARHKHAAVRVGDEVLFLGGATIPEPDGYFVDTERWKPTTRETTPGPPLAEGRYKFLDAVVVLPDGDVLVAGGGRHAERLDRGLDRFVRVRAALGAALAFSTVTPLSDGRILIAGGYDPNIRTRRSAWIYAPRDGSAITLAHEF
jgi:hypothetical protein